MTKKICAIAGVGPGNGAAISRKFSEQGYTIALLARSRGFLDELTDELGDAKAYVCDVGDEQSVNSAFAEIRREMGTIDTLIYNAGSGHFRNIDEASAADFETDWRVNALGLFLATREVLNDMVKNDSGNIIAIGATASLIGRAGFAPFASAKAAQYNLLQSMARYLWPTGIHVAYVVIDGIIDLEQTKRAMPDKSDEFFIKAEDIAKAVFYLTQQPRSAWTFQMDLRPHIENW
ncbi:MAG: SDR family NAD(P)-dependent oxidoreductase [Gammaproteobacteria bacterium]|nr:SDR family NAD(P)-dependent oxidoreductase [Gammaproteobacteria bacterium]